MTQEKCKWLLMTGNQTQVEKGVGRNAVSKWSGQEPDHEKPL